LRRPICIRLAPAVWPGFPQPHTVLRTQSGLCCVWAGTDMSHRDDASELRRKRSWGPRSSGEHPIGRGALPTLSPSYTVLDASASAANEQRVGPPAVTCGFTCCGATMRSVSVLSPSEGGQWVRRLGAASPRLAPTAIPRAGGSHTSLPPIVETLTTQYPGRQDHRREPFVDQVSVLAFDLPESGVDHLSDDGLVAELPRVGCTHPSWPSDPESRSARR
jgi:hypothetical protein